MFWEKHIKESIYETVQNKIHKNLWWWRGINIKKMRAKKCFAVKIKFKDILFSKILK